LTGDAVTPSKPGIFVRLGNIIVIQVLFIFSALALILFYPVPGHRIGSATPDLRQKLIRTGEAISLMLSAADDSSSVVQDRRTAFRELLSSEPSINYAALLRATGSGEVQLELSYTADTGTCSYGDDRQSLAEHQDSAMVLLVAESEPGSTMEAVFDTRHTVVYHRLHSRDLHGTPVMVAVIDHDLLVSPRSKLQYAILLLFLFSALISLLTIHLANKRFKQPLDRLIRGFEKTAEGELFYLVQPGSDAELDRLAGAFNQMSQQLWDNQKELKEYNVRLEGTNLALLESQLFLATLIDSSPLSIVVTDSAERILIFNQAASEVFGHPAAEIIGKPIAILFAESLQQQPQTGTNGESRLGLEVICKRKGGELFPAYVVTNPVGTQRSKLSGKVHVLLDISESKSFQEMMVRLDRYWTRGEMAGDIAHEINNYLAILMGNLELLPLLMKKGDDDKTRKKLELMKTTVERIGRFADGLVDSANDDVHFELTSLNQMLENIVAFAKPQNKFNMIQVTSVPSPNVPVIHVDQEQIQQVLVNLIFNAAEAMADREGEKRITVSTSVVEAAGRKCVKVEVRDNGPGVLSPQQPKLFKERFTTKRKGHGIGLITCRKILDLHAGEISYRFDGGAVFSILLPVERPADQRTEAPPVTTAAQT
jgi:PAS domain S-box-containing protein